MSNTIYRHHSLFQKRNRFHSGNLLTEDRTTMEKQRRYDTIERRNYKFLLNIFNNTEYSEAN